MAAFNVEDKGDHLVITVPKKKAPFKRTGGGEGKNVTIAYFQSKEPVDGDREGTIQVNIYSPADRALGE